MTPSSVFLYFLYKIIENKKKRLIIKENNVEKMKNNVIINILPEKSLRQITNIPNAVAPNNTIDVTAYDNIIVFI